MTTTTQTEFLSAPICDRQVKGTQSVPSVERVFTILEILARSSKGLTLRDLAESTGLPKSSVHCIIVTLQRCGYLHRNSRTSRYLFGRKLLMLTNTALGGLELREQAEPHMRSLARRTQLSVHLGIVEFSEALIVGKIDVAPGRLGVASWMGKRMELHCTGLGKALLSNWGEDQISQLIKDRALPRHNENTIGSARRLHEELLKVRRQGYAVDDEEDILGCRCIGAPIYESSGQVIAAMSVSGSVNDITLDNESRIASEVQKAALDVSQSLSEAHFM